MVEVAVVVVVVVEVVVEVVVVGVVDVEVVEVVVVGVVDVVVVEVVVVDVVVDVEVVVGVVVVFEEVVVVEVVVGFFVVVVSPGLGLSPQSTSYGQIHTRSLSSNNVPIHWSEKLTLARKMKDQMHLTWPTPLMERLHVSTVIEHGAVLWVSK